LIPFVVSLSTHEWNQLIQCFPKWLTISGTNLIGMASIRIVQSGVSDLAYVPAPDGTLNFILDPGSRAEFLISQDTLFHYRVNVLSKANYYSQILRKFGFESFTVDFGIDIPNSLTHVTTVVRAPDGKFYIFDPTFNAVYRTKEGDLADLKRTIEDDTVMFVARNIARDVRVSRESWAGFTDKGVVTSKSYDPSRCIGKKIDREEFYFCPEVPYDNAYLLDDWRDRLKIYSLGEGDDLIRQFFRRGEVYGITGGSGIRRTELADVLLSANVKIR